ncbi:thialysine N-epsilon-acetyltransferase-like [Candoia aspera]|uniref:thialysine N-epsilon-acetyltransferase-like n=1 Tax=Candoia aspera TaxID=51853 RepID=UPI002FD7E6A3
MSFLVRPWAKRDLRDVMRLVKELAVSHNALHQVKTSPEVSEVPKGNHCDVFAVLQQDGFREDAIFGYLVAEVPPTQRSKDGHTIVGYQFHYLTYCTWSGPILFGEDLYVMPEFRGRGIGTALLNQAVKIAPEKGCSQFRFISAENHQAATDFFAKKGAVNVTIRDSWHVFHMEEDHIVRLAEKATTELAPDSQRI